MVREVKARKGQEERHSMSLPGILVDARVDHSLLGVSTYTSTSRDTSPTYSKPTKVVVHNGGGTVGKDEPSTRDLGYGSVRR